MSGVNVGMLYEEVRKLSKRMDFIEELVEGLMIRGLPKVRLGKKEVEEIKSSLEQMMKGEYVTVEELTNA